MTQPPAFFDPAPAPTGTSAGASADPRMKFSQACQRNGAPILAVLQRVLPEGGLMLEIGAGTGQHAAYFAPHFPGLTWQPTEIDVAMHGSIAAWAAASREKTGAANIRPPLALDVTANPWPVEQEAGRSAGPTGKQQEAGSGGAATGKQRVTCVLSANMIHIAPWQCCEGLMAGAGRVLQKNGVFVLYGPFKQDGRHTADSNASFDASLRARDTAWGIRDLEAVLAEADSNGLDHTETVTMPANNLMLIFHRRG